MSSLVKITKRSGIGILKNSTKVLSSAQWATVSDNLAADIAQLVSEHNDKVKSILDGLAKGSDDSIKGLDSTFDAISKGLDGTVEFTDRRATSSDPNYLYSKSLSRPLSIKESITEVYNTLSQKVDNIVISEQEGISDYTKAYVGEKAFSSSLTSSAISMDGRIKALEVIVAAIEISDTDLSTIKAFIGLSGSENLPVYSDHYSGIKYIRDGISLEEASAKLDEAIQLFGTDFRHIVLDKDKTSPPASPVEDDTYIVAEVATGLWAGQEDKYALWNGTEWIFSKPLVGDLSYVLDEDRYYRYNDVYSTGKWVTDSPRLKEEIISAASFLYDAANGTSTYTLSITPDSNTKHDDFRILARNGVLDQTKVSSIPVSANQWRIVASKLEIFDDITTSADSYKIYYPYT